MIDELDKYRIEIFKIAGFAFMTPFGRIFFEPAIVFKEMGLLGTLIYILISIGLLVIGLKFLLRGYGILEYYDRK